MTVATQQSSPVEMEWDYGDGVVKNPVIESDIKFLKRVFNPSTYLLPTVKSSEWDTDSTTLSLSESTDTSVSAESSFRLKTSFIEAKVEAEELAETCVKFCYVDKSVDIREQNSVVSDKTSPQETSTGVCHGREAFLNFNRCWGLESSRKATTGFGMLKCSSSGSIATQDSVLGRSVQIRHRSLVDNLSFETDDALLVYGENEEDEDSRNGALLEPPSKKIVKNVFKFMKKQYLCGDSTSACMGHRSRTKVDLDIRTTPTCNGLNRTSTNDADFSKASKSVNSEISSVKSGISFDCTVRTRNAVDPK